MNEEALAVEAERLHERYTAEIVEAFNVCPWARHAREAGELTRRVLLQRDDDLAPTLAYLEWLEREAPRVVVAIAIYPLLALSAPRFDEFAGRLRRADQERHRGRPVFVAATFHPDYRLNPRSPAAAVPFFRKSPDPSLQLVRYDVIEAARGPEHGKFLFDFSPSAWEALARRQSHPSVTERITAENHELLARERPERLEAVYRALREDRERTYRRLGVPGV